MSDTRIRGLADRLIRLDDSHRMLSRPESESVWQRVKSFVHGGGETYGGVMGWWQGELRWARNRVSLASDRRDLMVGIHRTIGGSEGTAVVNQIDDSSLEAAVRAAERNSLAFGFRDVDGFSSPPPTFEYSKPTIWSDATYNLTTEARAALTQGVLEPAESQGMLSAGYLEVRALSYAAWEGDRRSSSGRSSYGELTQAQCSMTVRDDKGTGSGWAGLSSYDWKSINLEALAERALQKAIASRNPVALEPGRYTVVLEPQAVHDLVSIIVQNLGRFYPEAKGAGPFVLGHDSALNLWRTKLGLKVVDERITIDQDPMDPGLGVLPFDLSPDLAPRRAEKWIDRGVLTTLADFRQYALSTRNDNLPHADSGSFRMSGGETSVEEMIASTKRGLLVTRFFNIKTLDGSSLLSTGFTRDGLMLIENGKVSKAVKNFRFTESPLFVLNSIEQLGIPVPVFRPVRNPLGDTAHTLGLTPAIVPPLKARDFSFTSTIDAI
jgi:predicted Zn-dependent protease